MQGYIEKEGELKMMDIFYLIFNSFYPMNRILEKRVVDQIQKSADQILNMQLG